MMLTIVMVATHDINGSCDGAVGDGVAVMVTRPKMVSTMTLMPTMAMVVTAMTAMVTMTMPIMTVTAKRRHDAGGNCEDGGDHDDCPSNHR